MTFGVLRVPTSRVHDTPPPLHKEPADSATDAELAAYLVAARGDSVLYEVLAIGSPAFGALLDRVASGERPRREKLREAAVLVARHVVLAGTEGTPFGLLSGVAPVSFGERASVRIGKAHVKLVRPDRAWLDGLLRNLESEIEVLRVLDVVVNDQCVRKGGSFHLPLRTAGAQGQGADRTGRTVVKAQPVVSAAVRLARRPIGFGELVQRLSATFPDVPTRRLESQLTSLVRCEMLLTSLFPPLDCSDPLDHVARAIEAVPDSPVGARLRELAARFADSRGPTPGESCPAVPAPAKTVAPSCQLGGALVEVDLRSDADVTLPLAVAEEAASAAGVLWRLAPPEEPRQQTLRDYRRRFIGRYGRDALVPLLDLLDNERGLGAPRWVTQPAAEADGAGERDAVLAELAGHGGTYRREVVLTEEVVDRLARMSSASAAPTAEVRCRLRASGTAAVDAGDFQLVVLGGSRQAGAHIGRSTHVLPELGANLREALAVAVPGGSTPAQLYFRATEGFAYGLGSSPRLTDWSVSVGEFRAAAEHHVVRADDIHVGVIGARLRLMTSRTGRELHLIDVSMPDPRMAVTPAARLLREIALDHGRSWADWDWGASLYATRLPRVRYGKSILAPERWHADSAMREAGSDWTRWKQAFDAWRESQGVPATVQLGNDRRLTLDLNLTAHQLLLFEELDREPWIRIEEDLATSDAAAGWSGGYATELVVPLQAVAPTAPCPRPAARETTRTPSPPAVGDGIQVRIPSASPQHEKILAEQVPALINALGDRVDRWSFVREYEPHPRLLLRLHGPRQEQPTTVLPVLGTWTDELSRLGLAEDCSLVPYLRRPADDVGAETATLTEAVLHADSEVVLVQLRLTREKALRVDRQLLAAINFVAIARAFLPEDWASWLLRQVPRESHREAFRARRTELRELTGLGSQDLADRSGGPELAGAWRLRDAALCRYSAMSAGRDGRSAQPDQLRDDALLSLLDTHHNRAVGLDRESEGAIYALARGFAELATGAERYARG